MDRQVVGLERKQAQPAEHSTWLIKRWTKACRIWRLLSTRGPQAAEPQQLNSEKSRVYWASCAQLDATQAAGTEFRPSL